MLTPQLMACMDDAHLIRAAQAEWDDMTGTPLEEQLLCRLEAKTDEESEAAPLTALADEYGFSSEELKPLLECHPGSLEDMAALLKPLHEKNIGADDLEILLAMNEFLTEEGIEDVADLKKVFATAKQFRALAEDAGDVFRKLSTLATEAQEH